MEEEVQEMSSPSQEVVLVCINLTLTYVTGGGISIYKYSHRNANDF